MKKLMFTNELQQIPAYNDHDIYNIAIGFINNNKIDYYYNDFVLYTYINNNTYYDFKEYKRKYKNPKIESIKKEIKKDFNHIKKIL